MPDIDAARRDAGEAADELFKRGLFTAGGRPLAGPAVPELWGVVPDFAALHPGYGWVEATTSSVSCRRRGEALMWSKVGDRSADRVLIRTEAQGLRRRGVVVARFGVIAGAEAADDAGQLAGALFQGACGGEGLLHQDGVLLDGLIHVDDGVAGLLDGAGLLGGGLGDCVHQVRDLAGAVEDGVHGVARFGHQAAAAGDRFAVEVDELLYLARGVGRALRQLTHFGGHHGKAATLIAGAGGFDGGVQRQDVGLEGDVVDDADDAGDALGGVATLVHFGHDLATVFTAGFCSETRLAGDLVGLLGVVVVAPYGGADLFHGGAGLLQVGGLGLGALGQVGVAGGDLHRHAA